MQAMTIDGQAVAGAGTFDVVDPATGAVTRTISAGLTCPSIISIDPLSEDLFTDDSCTGAGSDNASIWRVTDPDGAAARDIAEIVHELMNLGPHELVKPRDHESMRMAANA